MGAEQYLGVFPRIIEEELSTLTIKIVFDDFPDSEFDIITESNGQLNAVTSTLTGLGGRIYGFSVIL